MDDFQVDLPGTHLSGGMMGRGPPLLVMPVSWGMDSTIYTKGLSALQSTARLIFFDPRGVGDSGPAAGDADLSLATLVEDAEAVREHLGVHRWTLLGHSNGGYGALSYALKFPDRVERLILIDTAASREFEEEVVPAMHKHPAFPDLAAAGERVRTEGTEDAFRDMMAAMFAMAVKDPERFRAANADLLEKMRFSPSRLRVSQEDLKGYDVRAQLWEIRAPTLVITGLHDLIVPHTATEALAQGIKTSRLLVFEDSGHWPFVEERERFVKEVRMFLEPMRAADEILGAIHEDEAVTVATSGDLEAEAPEAEPEVEAPEDAPMEPDAPAAPALEEEEIPAISPPQEPEKEEEPSEEGEIPGIEEADEETGETPDHPEVELPAIAPEPLAETENLAVEESPSPQEMGSREEPPLEAAPDAGPSPPPRPSLEDFLRTDLLAPESQEEEPEPPSPPLAEPEPEATPMEEEPEEEDDDEEEPEPATEEVPAPILQVVASLEVPEEAPDDSVLDVVERTPEEPPVLVTSPPRRAADPRPRQTTPPDRVRATRKRTPAKKPLRKAASRPLKRPVRKLAAPRRPLAARKVAKRILKPAKKAKRVPRRQTARRVAKKTSRRQKATRPVRRMPRKSKAHARKPANRSIQKKTKKSRRR